MIDAPGVRVDKSPLRPREHRRVIHLEDEHLIRAMARVRALSPGNDYAGNPSRIHPFSTQSSRSMRSLMSTIMKSSGTVRVESRYRFASKPSSVGLSYAASRSSAPGYTNGTSYFSASSRAAAVDFS